jgi:hypothetical protein
MLILIYDAGKGLFVQNDNFYNSIKYKFDS